MADDEQFKMLEQRDLPDQMGVYRHTQFTAGDVELYSVTLNANYKARLYHQEEKNQLFAKNLKDLSQDLDFLVGINGGYYTPSYQPAGLFIEQGKTYQKTFKGSRILTSCIGIDENNKLFIKKDRQGCLQANNAMQIGPWLINQGEINTDIKKYEDKPGYLESFFNKNRRTILAKTNDNKLLIIIAPSATLLEAATLLKDYPQAFGVKKVITAVNLDGGSSTEMFIKFKDSPFYFPGLKPVKTFVFFSSV